MPNAINYAQRYSQELDQAFVQSTLTNPLETTNVNWLGAKTFHVPSLEVTGYKNHSRNGGYNRGDVTVTHEPYTLSFDRDVEFFVDQMDVDESDQAASAANVTREFIQQHAGPEVDAYRFSKMATRAISEGNNTSEALPTDATAVVTRLREDIRKLRKYGTQNLTVYVTSDVMSAVEDFKMNKGSISLDNQGTVIETRIATLDGVTLIEVFDVDRFYTSFDFTTGFSPATGSYAINWIVVYRGAIISKAKLNSIYLFSPGNHTQGDGYLYQNRMYHDLFVMKNKADGIVVSHNDTALA